MELEPDEDAKPATPAGLLARRVARLRKRSGLSVRLLAEKVGYPYSYVGRVERGEQLPSEALAAALDEFFDTDSILGEMLVVAVEAEVPVYGRKVLEQERHAARIQTFNSSVVPGLLQTEAYTTALFTESMPGKDAENVALQVTARAHRQVVLASDQPPLYWAIIDESALRRPVGGSAVMAGQIRHIVNMIENNSSVCVQVLPFARGVHPLQGGSLTLLTLRDGLTFAYVESFASGRVVDSPADVLELATRYDIARSKALDSGESLAMFIKYLKEYENDHDE
ncbi:helix-turn-helix domain-containing protein [Streptomyces sp. S5]|uniref:helix-turn-helix domain-containing protein n=1 Tax=Streptomyces sp. S5 TaxID=1456735 RepID=UPI000EF8A7EA|nr:helix-turn-helix transcriptional regulator [Streptomyces sp. S5]